MTLEKHIVDTMKEWQIKIGSFDSGIRLYYPKHSLCHYLSLDADINNAELSRYIEHYLTDDIKYLGKVTVSAERERFCILVGREGCEYVEREVPEPEFLMKFLNILKYQNMQNILELFKEYAKERGTHSCVETEGDETIVYFEDENVEPYVYCIDQNEFGITYHRFTKEDYREL